MIDVFDERTGLLNLGHAERITCSTMGGPGMRFNGPVLVDSDQDPLFTAKDYRSESLFTPGNLLREGRRQRELPDINVPATCLLDPDGDIVRHLRDSGYGYLHPGWACYHTQMWTVDLEGLTIGVVGIAVGASVAVLVAEQLAASGATLV